MQHKWLTDLEASCFSGSSSALFLHFTLLQQPRGLDMKPHKEGMNVGFGVKAIQEKPCSATQCCMIIDKSLKSVSLSLCIK